MHFSDMELTCRADGRAVVVSPRMVFVMAMEATQMQFFSNSRKLLARIDEPMITFLATSCQPNNFSPNKKQQRVVGQNQLYAAKKTAKQADF